MEAIVNSFSLVFLGEMGDKTQLLALILAARYKKPWTVLAGIFVATVLNHAMASWLGTFVASFMSTKVLSIVLAMTFFAFAAWILVPDKEEEVRAPSRFGPFATTVVAFFLAEMGDKTQLATIALAARYSNIMFVTIGSTLGMMASNALAVFLGDKFLARIPMKWMRIAAATLFAIFGAAIVVASFFGLGYHK